MSTSPNRMLGIVFGAVYLVIGGVGFAFTSGVSFFATSGGLLLGIFEVNPFHNVAHLAIGAILLIAGLAGIRPAKALNITIGVAYFALFIAGLFLVGTSANILSLNAADNVLHIASAAVLLAVGLGAEHGAKSAAKTA